MKTIVLISCVSKKIARKAKVEQLYVSPLFKLSLRYARSLNPDGIFVLSAKHGLVDLEQVLEPYNLTLNEMPARAVNRWAASVLEQLHRVADLRRDRVVFLAGEKYRKYLLPHISNYEVPLQGLSLGRQMKFLKEEISDC